MAKKDRNRLEAVEKKVAEILEDPHRFKPLRAPMQDKRRVHGHRGEGIDRDPAAPLGAVEGHDHHPGREPPEARAQRTGDDGRHAATGSPSVTRSRNALTRAL